MRVGRRIPIWSLVSIAAAGVLSLQSAWGAATDSNSAMSASVRESFNPGRNQKNVETPRQILRCGIYCHEKKLSGNAKQLADSIKLTAVMNKIAELREKDSKNSNDLSSKVDLINQVQEALQLMGEANLSVDAVLAEIQAERGIYAELLSTYQSDSTKRVNKANWMAKLHEALRPEIPVHQ